MALPPSIPTSFVPHPGSAGGAPQRFKTDYTGAFGFFAYIVLGIAFMLALGVFAYGRILDSQKESKAAELAKAETEINPATAAEFVRLKNRLSYGKSLLDSHIALSEFLQVLGTLLPTSVRLSALTVSVDSTGVPTVEGAGVARNFNALAVASTALSADGRIKDVIFSNIKIDGEENTVSFSLTARLDPKLVTFSL